MASAKKKKKDSQEKKNDLNEEKYQELVEHLNEVVFTIDDKGVITYISPRIEDLSGYKPEEVIGSTFKKFVFEEDLSSLMDDFQANISGEVKPSEYRLESKDGKVVWVYSKSKPIKKNGKIVGLQGALTDITERKEMERELEESKKRFEDIIRSSSDWIWEIDEEMEYTFVSEGVKKILGYDPEELIGKAPFEFMPGQEAVRVKRIFKESMKVKKAIEDLEICHLTKGGKQVWILTNGVPILDEYWQIRGYRGIGKDITHRKEIERMKNELIALSSHQLRSPLSITKWGLLALEEDGMGHLSDEQKDYLRRINISNERMIDLVELLVNVSRIDSNSLVLRPEPIDLKEIATNEIKELESEFDEKDQEVILNTEGEIPSVEADYRLTKRVVRNYLTNAHKYTPKEGKITVSLYQKGEQVFCEVQDTGYGIPEEQQEEVFGKFFRGSNVLKKEEPEGLGIGLYFVKTVIEMSGGEVGFESEEDQGSTFWFSLPVKDSY
ncbi:MAG: PAS domain S-box protein [Candidatus Nealsonbacteria bacterium]|nr:PAS domain S-box protein [Candidatus Nealsonbacteria bacterium]